MTASVRIGSLFSGIGGLERGLELAGLGPVEWQCEIDPWCRRVLAKHWPGVRRFRDVSKVVNPPVVDLICGGFPCTNISFAGKGEGLDGDESGLWWEYARIIREAQPRWVVIENVAALVNRGLDVILWSLAESGYDARWDCIPAAAIGAPHRRDRLFVVARLADSDGGRRESERLKDWEPGHAGTPGDIADGCGSTQLADPGSERQQEGDGSGEQRGRAAAERGYPAVWPPRPDDMHAWRQVPALSQPSLCRLADGVPERLVRNRRQALKAYGNAVVPMVSEVIGRMIMAAENRSAA